MVSSQAPHTSKFHISKPPPARDTTLLYLYQYGRPGAKAIDPEKNNNIDPYLFWLAELFAYISTIIILLIDILAFKNFRHFNFFLSTTSNAQYIVFHTVVMLNALSGLAVMFYAGQTYRLLNLRRAFFETCILLILWLTAVHDHGTHSSIFLLAFISLIYVNLRTIHFVMTIIAGRWWMILLTGLFLAFAGVFFILYNIVPLLEHYFFSFEDLGTRVAAIIMFFWALPSFALATMLPFFMIRNTIEAIQMNRPGESAENATDTGPVGQRTIPGGRTHLDL
jgi:hypothetical protein